MSFEKYSINPSQATATTTTERITNVKIVIDRFHFTNHVDKWCRTNCNLDTFEELKEVRTYIIIIILIVYHTFGYLK